MKPELILHNSQIEAFSAAGIEQFYKKMYAFVRDKYATTVAKKDDEHLKKDIAHLIQQARGFGFKTEYDMMEYISHNYFYSWNGVISNEEILTLFKNKKIVPGLKLRILKDLLKK